MICAKLVSISPFQTYNIQHGAIVSLGHISANCVSSESSTAVSVGGDNFVRRAINRLGKSGELNNLKLLFTPPPPHFIVEVASTAKISQLSMLACSALGDIFRSGPLPFPEGDPLGEKDGELVQALIMAVSTGIDGELTQRNLVTCLSKLLKSAKEIKVLKVSSYVLSTEHHNQ